MTKRNNLIYWIATIWLALGMVSTGIVQIIQLQEEVDNFSRLGFPVYLMPFIGILKILGVVAVLVPRFPLLKEWAYAGLSFAMAGAAYAHIAVGDAPQEIFGPALLLLLTSTSWYFRPTGRKIISTNH